MILLLLIGAAAAAGAIWCVRVAVDMRVHPGLSIAAVVVALLLFVESALSFHVALTGP